MKAQPNNSMDVRANQRLSYQPCSSKFAALTAICQHTIPAVGQTPSQSCPMSQCPTRVLLLKIVKEPTCGCGRTESEGCHGVAQIVNCCMDNTQQNFSLLCISIREVLSAKENSKDSEMKKRARRSVSHLYGFRSTSSLSAQSEREFFKISYWTWARSRLASFR